MRKPKLVSFQFSHPLAEYGVGNNIAVPFNIQELVPEKNLTFISAHYAISGLPIDYNILVTIGGLQSSLVLPLTFAPPVYLNGTTLLTPNSHTFTISKHSPNYYAPATAINLIAGQKHNIILDLYISQNPVCEIGILTLFFIQHD
jgi:hypothetical protein